MCASASKFKIVLEWVTIDTMLNFDPCNGVDINSTRMHSSRMRTTRSSSRLLGKGEGAGGCLPQCMLENPLGVGLDPPLGVGLETPPGQTHKLPPGCGPGDPLQARPLNFPLGRGPGDLQGMLGCHPPWTKFLTHSSENSTLPQKSFAGGKNYV